MRIYAFGDYEDHPASFCHACFHRQLADDGEIGRKTRFFLRDGFLTVESWLESDVLPQTVSLDQQTAATPSVTAATSAALIARHNAAQDDTMDDARWAEKCQDGRYDIGCD